MKIIFFGSPQFVTPILNTLHENFELVGAVTTPDQKVGRKQILTPTAVKIFAKNINIPVFEPEKLDDQLKARLQDLNPDLFIVAAYGKIIPQTILDVSETGSLNVHPSLLPLYRGASPIQSALLNGDKATGITIYKMDQKMDHGPIIFQQEFSLTNQYNNESLSNKLFIEASKVIPQIITDFAAGKIDAQIQDESKATFCKTLTKQSGYFDISQPPKPEQLDRMIRAYYPWPTAWTTWNGKIVKFYPNQMVQMEGKNLVHLNDFLRGYPDFPLKTLSSN